MNRKPGDLAILVNAKINAENIGKIFEVLYADEPRMNGDFWALRN